MGQSDIEVQLEGNQSVVLPGGGLWTLASEWMIREARYKTKVKQLVTVSDQISNSRVQA